MGNLKTNSGTKFKTDCWNNIDIYLGEDKIHLQYNDKTNLLCSDLILWGSHNKIRFETWLIPFNKSISLDKQELIDINLYGISFFKFNNGLPKTLYSIYQTMTLLQR